MSRDYGASKRRRGRGSTATTIAVVLCALAGAMGVLAPTQATAMTTEELGSICASVFAEIGDPSICSDSFPSGWGGSGGGSVAIEIKPGVIDIVDTKPGSSFYCGSGISVRRLEDCPQKRRPSQGLNLTQHPGRPPIEVEVILPRGPGQMRAATAKGTVKRCRLARRALSEAKDALAYLNQVQNSPGLWGPGGMFLNKHIADQIHTRANQGWNWFTLDTVVELAKKYPIREDGTDLYYLNRTALGWEMTKAEVERDLNSPTCRSKAGQAES